MVEPRIYYLYGLHIRSEIPLPASVSDAASVDLDIRWSNPVAIPSVPPAGSVIALFEQGNGQGYAITESEAGYTLRYYSTCEFHIATDRCSVRVCLDPRADPGIAAVLLSGNVLAFILTIAGECVLHASAVEVEGAAIGFVGASGMGKSTLAALLCAAGARLVTDDVLRLHLGLEPPRCFVGPAEIRLRPGSAMLARHFPENVNVTIDERTAVRPNCTTVSGPGLAALVVPRPRRDAPFPCVRRISSRDALLQFLACPRIPGWRDTETSRTNLRGLAQLARAVKVFEADVPWGPPFAAETAEALLSLSRQSSFR